MFTKIYQVSPQKIKVFYEDKDMEEYKNLDSPIQLMDRKSNKLHLKSEDEENKENSDEKTLSRYDIFYNYITKGCACYFWTNNNV